jgi:hypothetical protein
MQIRPKKNVRLLLVSLLLPIALHAQELLYPHPVSPEWAKRQPLNHALEELAGSKAERCGRVPVGHDPQPWTDCARTAFREKRPFYVRYDVNSFPDRQFESAFGIASDGSGLLYQVEYWTYWSGLSRPPIVADENLKLLLDPTNVRVRLCSSPARLRLTKYGALTCFASDPLADIPAASASEQY